MKDCAVSCDDLSVSDMLRRENLKNVVVRGTNWVGDAIMTIPALRELRRALPEAHLTLTTRANTADIFIDAEFIDEISVIDGSSTLRTARSWSRKKFDLAVLFTNSFQSALIPVFAGVPNRLGYATECRGLLLTSAVRLPSWRQSRHEVYYYLNLIWELENQLNGHPLTAKDPDTKLAVSPERTAEARSLLENCGIVASEIVVAVCPGSINSRAKRWPAERFAEVADKLIDKGSIKVLLIGSPNELDIATEVAARMRQKPVQLTGTTSLAEVTAILSQVDLVITNDTGPAHIASALGRQTLVIFGPTDPLTTRPFGDNAHIVRKPPDCAPCMLRDCPIDHRCMTAISVDEVVERASEIIAWTRDAEALADKELVTGQA